MENKEIDLKILWYLIPLLVVGSVFGVMQLNKEMADIKDKYPLVISSDEVNVVISDARDVRKYKGSTLIKTAKSTNLSIRAYNWSLENSNLYDNLETGDSISRKPYSDILYLYKKKGGSVIEFEIQCFE